MTAERKRRYLLDGVGGCRGPFTWSGSTPSKSHSPSCRVPHPPPWTALVLKRALPTSFLSQTKVLLTPSSNLTYTHCATVLSDKLQFVEEIGFGNWGSVWLCRPKEDLSASPDDPTSPSEVLRLKETKLAVKLVHRSKTSTTAARVRSLYVASFTPETPIHDPWRV